MTVTVPTIWVVAPFLVLVLVVWWIAWREFMDWFDPKFRRWYWQRHFDGEPPDDWGRR